MNPLERIEIATHRAFKETRRDSPLQKLDLGDKLYLVYQLLAFEAQSDDRDTPDPRNVELERMHKLVVRVGRMAESLKTEIFNGPGSDILAFHISGFEQLPKHMRLFSLICDGYLSRFGKLGHKREISIGCPLVGASEFIKAKLGSYFDDHLVDLLQAIPRGKQSSPLDADLARKRRQSLKNRHLSLYRALVESATEASNVGLQFPEVSGKKRFYLILAQTLKNCGT